MIDVAVLPQHLQTPEVTLDWEAYYRAFKELHGDPVQHSGRLLFRDGWTYSASDYAGPEWPPPTDATEMRKLGRAYWTERRKVVVGELRQAEHLTENIRMLQAAKNAPLYQRIVSRDESGKYVEIVAGVDAAYNTDRIAWLQSCLRECDEQLQEIG